MSQADPATQKPLRKLLIEFGPLVTFFLAQRYKDIYWATGVFMVAISISVLASRRIEHRWPVVPLVTAVFVLVMGGLTLWLQDATFIMMKPTIVNLLFAAILLGGLAWKRLFLKTVFAEAFDLEDEGWSRLTLRFGLFFVFLAGVNEIVWRTQSEDVWTSFKVFGIAPLTIVFMLLQGRLVERYTRSRP
ncbi:MAG: septation protein A [Planctomycetota bacterium]|jgi:intracellular septation protein|nr:septation protein A [Planctomycetota bacterium]MDP6939749.1 septation protein A [Planctomycetota bacterium]